MKTKYIIRYALMGLAALTFSACNDWLEEDTPGVTRLSDYFEAGNETAAENVVNSAYEPLQWEYDNNTYCAEWFIGDIASDDALKGGQNIADGPQYFDIDNFKVQADNSMLLGYYRAQWTGISRANLAITQLPYMSGDSIDNNLRSRLIAEAHFLRAYYYFRLVRIFGGMPLIDDVIDSSNKWHQERASVEDTYQFIIDDLKAAEAGLWVKSAYADEDLGRATKGAAQAMLLKAYLYIKDYSNAKTWGEKVIAQANAGEYALLTAADGGYFQNFTLDGENGKESVFEIQFMDDDMSDYGVFGHTRGSFTQVLTRSRSSKLGKGWGFNHPTQNLYDEYETAPTLDPRRDLTILNPAESDMVNPEEEIYCGNRYMNNKLAWRNLDGTFPSLSHDSRGPLNNRQIRYADVLLMYAEACCEGGDLTAAKNALNQVRQRAGLAAFPYTATYQGASHAFADNQNDLRTAIRHERRVELAMEGHRWFDLVRWGIAKQTLDAYIAKESDEAKQQWGYFQEGKNELFPIPTQEQELSGIAQNPGY